MHRIINATYCVNYADYDFLFRCIEAVGKGKTGIEVSANLDKPEQMERLSVQRARLLNVPVTMHGPFTDVECASAPGSLERKHTVDSFRRAFDLYEDLNAQSIVMHTHHMRDIPESEMEKLRGWSLDTMLEIAQIAIDRKVTLTVENVGHWVKSNLLFNEEQFLRLFDALPPEIGCLFDVGHALINRWDISHVIHALNARIFSFHLHNNNGSADAHRPMFEAGNRYAPGEMTDLLRVIHQCAPDADLILEYSPSSAITEALICDDLKTLLAVAEQ